jgi:hypothetical protein
MATYRYVAFDLLKSLKQMNDDSNVRLPQVVYWVQVVANKLRVDQFMKTDSGQFTSTFSNITVMTDSNGKKYIDLPNQIMDLPNEEGVELLTYCAEHCNPHPQSDVVFFEPTTLAKTPLLYMNEYTEPEPNRPYFYRVGDKVDGTAVSRLYLLGIECVEVDCVDIAIRCSLNPSNVCDLDDEIPLPDERIKELMDEILMLGRFVMMMPEERVNQGSDQTSPNSVPQTPPSTQTDQ